MQLQYIFLQAGASSQLIPNLIFIGAIIIVFYFFMLRPQQKKQKEQQLFRENLKVGDKVITTGGVHGKIVEVTSDTVTLDVDRGVKIVFDKASVSDEMTKKASTKAA